MDPVIPAEMVEGAMQLAIYLIAAIGVFLSLMWTARA